jgi:thymidine kinase
MILIKSILHAIQKTLYKQEKGNFPMAYPDPLLTQREHVHPASQDQAHTTKERGSLVVICGSMFSGKTEELIRIISRLVRSGKHKIATFKHGLDKQRSLHGADGNTNLTSRNGSYISCVATDNTAEIKQLVDFDNTEIIAIDEIQFFDKDAIVALINQFIKQGKKVIVSGLDLDFRSEPFSVMAHLLALADNVIKLTAICAVCGADTYCISQRLVNGKPAHYNDPMILIGSQEYEARCRKCHVVRKD